MTETVNALCRRLMELAASGANAQTLVETAYICVQKPIALLDGLYRQLAFYAPGIDPSDCERKVDNDVAQRRQWHRRVESSKEPVIDEHGGGPYRAMCMEVRFSGNAIAKLSMMETSPFTPMDAEVLKVLADALAFQYVGSHGEIRSSRDRERTDLLLALLKGENLSNDFHTLTAYLQIPENMLIRVMVFASVQDSSEDFSNLQQTLLEMFDAIFAKFHGQLICVTGDDEYQRYKAQIIDHARRMELRCAVSRSFRRFSAIKDYYRQALGTLRVLMTTEKISMEYNECVAEDIIALCRADRDLHTFCREEIVTLYEYDIEHSTDYLDTLRCYLECLCSMADTARATFLHYNTIKYRLRMIREICGIHEFSAADLCEFLLSIRILSQ